MGGEGVNDEMLVQSSLSFVPKNALLQWRLAITHFYKRLCPCVGSSIRLSRVFISTTFLRVESHQMISLSMSAGEVVASHFESFLKHRKLEFSFDCESHV